MTVTIAGITFDRVRYDAEGDVLYLHVGDPSAAVDFDGVPEGHHVRYGANGELGTRALVGGSPNGGRRHSGYGNGSGFDHGSLGRKGADHTPTPLA